METSERRGIRPASWNRCGHPVRAILLTNAGLFWRNPGAAILLALHFNDPLR